MFPSVAPGGSVVKDPPARARDEGDMGSIPGLKRSPAGGTGNPLQYSWRGNPMDGGAWRATFHGVTKRAGCDLMTKQQTQWLTVRFIVLIHFYSHRSQRGFPWSASAPCRRSLTNGGRGGGDSQGHADDSSVLDRCATKSSCSFMFLELGSLLHVWVNIKCIITKILSQNLYSPSFKRAGV